MVEASSSSGTRGMRHHTQPSRLPFISTLKTRRFPLNCFYSEFSCTLIARSNVYNRPCAYTKHNPLCASRIICILVCLVLGQSPVSPKLTSDFVAKDGFEHVIPLPPSKAGITGVQLGLNYVFRLNVKK